jgi:hypothetical protein
VGLKSLKSLNLTNVYPNNNNNNKKNNKVKSKPLELRSRVKIYIHIMIVGFAEIAMLTPLKPIIELWFKRRSFFLRVSRKFKNCLENTDTKELLEKNGPGDYIVVFG